MDKQQSAKNYALKKNFKDSPGPIDIVTTSYSDGLQAGWEAHEAQFAGDAVEFAEWAEKGFTMLPNGLWECNDDEYFEKYLLHPDWEHTTADLYKLFNPSGAAPHECRSIR